MEQVDNIDEIGIWARDLMLRLYPICRSLSGPGNRETFDILGEEIPLDRIEIPSGQEIYDWSVPNEWNPRNAWIVDPTGVKHAVFSDNNLNLVGYSQALDEEFDLEDLLPHIYSLPEQPDVVPYVTRYYEAGWGFCMTDKEKKSLLPGRYRVHIDAELYPGSMSLAEVLLPGKSEQEILISTYMCHPSMANDNLSGLVVAAALYKLLSQIDVRRLSYRIVFVPETIGSLAWLNYQDKENIDRVVAGMVLSCLGYDSPFIWKRSRSRVSIVDRIAEHCIGQNGSCMDFNPVTGSDERQYCSPGFNMPIGMLSRSYPGTFSTYHTSADIPALISKGALSSSIKLISDICLSIDSNSEIYRRVQPNGEPMLAKRGLYNSVSIKKSREHDRSRDLRTHLMWYLNYSDGLHDLIDIAEISGIPISNLAKVAEHALEVGLVERF